MQRFGKKDVALIAVLLGAALLCLLIVQIATGKSGSQVEITVDGVVYGTYALEKDQTIPIQKKDQVMDILQISDGKAKMIQADCPDQLCIHQKAISAAGETIVCLPNKIVVTVLGENEQELDSVAN